MLCELLHVRAGQGIGAGVSAGSVGAPAGDIVPAVTHSGGVGVDGNEKTKADAMKLFDEELKK